MYLSYLSTVHHEDTSQAVTTDNFCIHLEYSLLEDLIDAEQ